MRAICTIVGAIDGCPRETRRRARMDLTLKENFSLIVMCVFLVLSLAFLAQQISAYH